MRLKDKYNLYGGFSSGAVCHHNTGYSDESDTTEYFDIEDGKLHQGSALSLLLFIRVVNGCIGVRSWHTPTMGIAICR